MDEDCRETPVQVAETYPTPMPYRAEADRCKPEYDVAVMIVDIIAGYAGRPLNLCKVRMFAEAMLNR